ncbi:MAG: hypothetical protein WKG01_13920 [Kofleriaceae bacterium]
MRRILSMSPGGRFAVTADADGILSTALSIALAPQHGDAWQSALAPDGNGLEVEGIGMIARAFSREELPLQFQYDESVDPVANEIWWIQSEFTSAHPTGTWAIISGDELRALVQAGSEMRQSRP